MKFFYEILENRVYATGILYSQNVNLIWVSITVEIGGSGFADSCNVREVRFFLIRLNQFLFNVCRKNGKVFFIYLFFATLFNFIDSLL